jgi:hypothetical protein
MTEPVRETKLEIRCLQDGLTDGAFGRGDDVSWKVRARPGMIVPCQPSLGDDLIMANNGSKPVWQIAAYRFSTAKQTHTGCRARIRRCVAKTYRQPDSTAIILGYRRLSLANNPPILYPVRRHKRVSQWKRGLPSSSPSWRLLSPWCAPGLFTPSTTDQPDSSLATPTDCGIKWKHLNEARRRLDPVVTKVDKRS